MSWLSLTVTLTLSCLSNKSGDVNQIFLLPNQSKTIKSNWIIDFWLLNIIKHQSNTKKLVNFDCSEFKRSQTITCHKGSLTKMALIAEFIRFISFCLTTTSVHSVFIYLWELKKKSNKSKQSNKGFILVNFDLCLIMFANRTPLVWLALIEFQWFDWLFLFDCIRLTSPGINGRVKKIAGIIDTLLFLSIFI